jgi:predicted amidohydrolase YtcJ
MWEALARWDNDGKQKLGDSGLTRVEALRLATVAGHHLTWDENTRGPLAPGMAADFVVLGEDPLTCQLDRIRHIVVERTFVSGRQVFP